MIRREGVHAHTLHRLKMERRESHTILESNDNKQLLGT